MNERTNFDSVLNAHNMATQVKREVSEPKRSDTPKDTKQARRDEMRKECYDMLDNTYHILRTDLNKYKQFLDLQSNFESYSVNNNVLIFAQRPGATRVKDFDGWSEDDLTIRKGVTGIMILMPRPYEKDGEQRTAYEVKKVFDVSDLKELPSFDSISFEKDTLVRALVNKSPVAIVTNSENTSTYYSVKDKRIYAKVGMSFEELFTNIALALAHAEMARGADTYRIKDNTFQARSVAYILAKKYGVPTKSLEVMSLPAKYADMELKEIKEEFGEIHRAVKAISGRMNEILLTKGETERKNEGKGER